MKKPAKKKILLIGWDAADWKVINPLLDAGKMPNLERLINNGVMGNLSTLSPSLSPMLWTSIATGKRPFKHGILGFTEPVTEGGGIRPISSLSRKTRALWNILHLNNMTSNVVGWWPSHPVEPIRGVMVSNHYQRAHLPIDKPWPMQKGTVHPRRLAKHLAGLRLHPAELGPDAIFPFVPEFEKINQAKDRRLESLAKIIADCTSIHAAATALMQLEPWDFMAVYYDAIDHFCHGFMRYHPPRMAGVSEEDYKLFNGVVAGGYRFHDMMLGTLLTLAGEETTVILISDHGFHPDHLRPVSIPLEPAGPAVQHREHGIFVIKGPGIKKDEIIHGASLLDITPTVLYLYGLPVGEDMDGVPLLNALIKPAAVTTVPSWDNEPGEDGSHSENMLIDPVEARQAINQLVALGYIEKPDENAERAAAEAVRELQYNLARSYMDANRHLEAVPALQKLTAEWPMESRFGINLVMCYQSLGRISEAGEALRKLFENKGKTAALAREKLAQWQKIHNNITPEHLDEKQRNELRSLRNKAGYNSFAMEYLKASQLLTEGDAVNAMIHLDRSEKLNSKAPQVYIKKGEAFLMQKKYHEAEESFRGALDLNAGNVEAHLGLCMGLLGRRMHSEAAGEALSAIGLSYFTPRAHYLLGVALSRMRRPLQAVEALKVAVLQNPNHIKGLRLLAFIFERRLKDPDTAADYRKRADEAVRQNRGLRTGSISPTNIQQPKRTAMTSDLDILEMDGDRTEKLFTSLDSTVIIVSGLPRSGTSMMMQMLTAGGISPLMDDHRPANIHNEKGYYEDARAKTLHRDASWLPKARGKAVKIVAQLLTRLPGGRKHSYGVIFMVRDLKEVIASQRDMLKDQGKQGACTPDDILGNTFVTQLQQTRKFLAIRRIPTLFVQHRNCLENPAAEAARINAFLGGGLDEAAMAGAVAPKLSRHKLKRVV